MPPASDQQPPAPIAQPSDGRLSFLEKSGYALGDAASNFYWQLFSVFLMMFYTDVFGLAAPAAGLLLLVTRFGDAVLDPLMGALADRTRSRAGRFRPYLLWGALPLALSSVLVFTVPRLSGNQKLLWAYVSYFAALLAYTVVNIPYSALLGVMTPNSDERTRLSTYRFVGAFVVALGVQKWTPDLVQILGNGDAAAGWQRTMALYGVAASLLFVVCYGTTRERVQPSLQQKAALGKELRALASNVPWRLLMVLSLLAVALGVLRGTGATYYFTYFVRRNDLLGWYLATGGLALLVGVLLTQPLVARLGKRRLYGLSMGAHALLTGLAFFARPTDLSLLFVLNALASLASGPTAPLLWSMYADAADHGEWTTGRRSTGLVFSSALFALKLGGALGSGLLGLLLSVFGYRANAIQTDQALLGLRLLFALSPALLGVAAAALMIPYGLNETRIREIEAGLRERRASEGSSRSR